MIEYRLKFNKTKKHWVWDGPPEVPKIEELLTLLFLNEKVYPRLAQLGFVKAAAEIKTSVTNLRRTIKEQCEKRGMQQSPKNRGKDAHP